MSKFQGAIMEDFNFNFEFVASGAPIVTLSALGIAFNPVCRAMLGYPEKINIGFDEKKMVIGVQAHNPDTTIKAFDFEIRERNGWIRVGAKDYIKYLSLISKIDFITKAKQFIATFDEERKMLLVMIDEEHVKK